MSHSPRNTHHIILVNVTAWAFHDRVEPEWRLNALAACLGCPIKEQDVLFIDVIPRTNQLPPEARISTEVWQCWHDCCRRAARTLRDANVMLPVLFTGNAPRALLAQFASQVRHVHGFLTAEIFSDNHLTLYGNDALNKLSGIATYLWGLSTAPIASNPPPRQGLAHKEWIMALTSEVADTAGVVSSPDEADAGEAKVVETHGTLLISDSSAGFLRERHFRGEIPTRTQAEVELRTRSGMINLETVAPDGPVAVVDPQELFRVLMTTVRQMQSPPVPCREYDAPYATRYLMTHVAVVFMIAQELCPLIGRQLDGWSSAHNPRAPTYQMTQFVPALQDEHYLIIPDFSLDEVRDHEANAAVIAVEKNRAANLRATPLTSEQAPQVLQASVSVPPPIGWMGWVGLALVAVAMACGLNKLRR